MSGGLTIRPVGPEDAPAVLQVVRAAFGDRPPLDPPTDALAETVESIAARLQGGRGLLAVLDGRPVGTVLLDPSPAGPGVYLRRFGVVPAAQGHGVAHGLVRAALRAGAEIEGVDRVVVLAREELPATIGFWERQGFGEVDRHAPYVELARPVAHRVDVPTADDMRRLALRLSSSLRAGDVLVLSGELGAGKTTFTQGLGEGLGVRGDVTSPTFVISRVHPSLGSGPDLVHVDAYRLHDGAELDDLDLDASLEDAVTVVEWGAGLADALSDDPLHVRIGRSAGGAGHAGDPGDPGDPSDPSDPRTVEIDPHGARWLDVPLPR
jgi:tRNA threonylcarbamoyladenosine biosynthesis protein TsaE